jgi:hypothetical protein
MRQIAAGKERLDMAQHTASVSLLTNDSDAAAISLSRGQCIGLWIAKDLRLRERSNAEMPSVWGRAFHLQAGYDEARASDHLPTSSE